MSRCKARWVQRMCQTSLIQLQRSHLQRTQMQSQKLRRQLQRRQLQSQKQRKQRSQSSASAEDASADPVAKEDAAEPAAEPAAEIALPHISNFYTTSTEGNKGRTRDIDAWQAMVESNCPELHLLPTEGDMAWSTEMMPVMVANSLPTGYTPEVHQFLAQHFDYGRNLVIIDMLAVKKYS